jgi:1-deoxy-D-xylulose-5-phosphate synthase
MRMTVEGSEPSKRPPTPLLHGITGPQSVAELDHGDLTALAAEIRAFLVEKVCATGGHLGVNLGVVELTIALHRVFRSPQDVIVFDTGHQSYVHKILTGRHAAFDGLRQYQGLSGYPSRAESEHDWVENSHASTALSYADGIAKALKVRGELADGSGGGRHVVAVIGDGALTGGMAWEGLNNLSAAADRPTVIVLNDNGRSYAPTFGGLADHLADLRDGSDTGPARNLFENLGLAYLGRVDGHDVGAVEAALRQAAGMPRPVVVHVVTEKGRGYRPAEDDAADRMHGIGVLDPRTGSALAASRPSWTEVFGAEICAVADEQPDVVCLSAAMVSPVGLGEFARRFPDRVFDVGIAEQHAVCSAAGLALGGLHPVVCLYATFLNRAFDQVLMDVALHRAGVTFVLDRAGVTGPDGASHHGMWDHALLGMVPDLRLAAPRDPARLRELLREAVGVDDGPTVIRFPKADAGPDIEAVARMNGIDILYRAPGRPLDVLIVAAGVTAGLGLTAARELDALGIGATVVDPRWILPPHPDLPHLAARHRLVVTVEDGVRSGGMGTALAQACADARVATPVRVVGLPRAFLAAGGREQILDLAGTTARDVVALAVSGLTDLAEVPDLTGSTPAVDGLGSPLTGLGAEF